MFRSSDGKVRVDTGNTSLISNPKEQQAILLDHVTKEARVIPMQGGPPQPGLPLMGPATPSTPSPAAPPMKVQDLGKSLIEGQEVDGKRYIIPPPAPPAAPGLPPGLQKPGLPAVPPSPTTVDVWTSSKLGLPVMTQVTGPFGQQTCMCKTAPTAEPHPGLFQIPPGYTPVMPPRPSARSS
jgi:hypothetical protein